MTQPIVSDNKDKNDMSIKFITPLRRAHAKLIAPNRTPPT